MTFNILKKKNSLPSLNTLRPKIFNTELYWFASLALTLLVIAVTAFVGFKLFYYQYYETYKESESTENFENIINVNRLNTAIEIRNSFLTEQISLPRDPSL